MSIRKQIKGTYEHSENNSLTSTRISEADRIERIVDSERQEWAETTGLNKCFESHLSGMSELNEKREVILTKSLEERKKGLFWLFFRFLILEHSATYLFVPQYIYKLQRGYSVYKFQTRQRTSHQKDKTLF